MRCLENASHQFLIAPAQRPPYFKVRLFEESLSMTFRSSTLLDVLSSQQFRTAVLITLGLGTSQIGILVRGTRQFAQR